MNPHVLRFLTVLPLTALLGCDSGVLVDPEALEAQRASAAIDFVFDSTRIATPPTGGLPTTLLSRTAFDDSLLQGALIGTTEAFTDVEAVGTRRDRQSRTWTLESDSSEGHVVVMNNLGGGPATPQEPAVLQRTAVARLLRWGIPSAEMGPVYQVRSYVQDREDGVVSAPSVHRHKTFVMRAINGIRVEGHRAVVSHGVDGSFQRAFIAWPPLARTGHLLRTRLSTADIEQRAREALRAEGERSGNVRLFWKYAPTQVSTGEWGLTLEVGAAMDSVTGENGTEEPRIIDVDVSPVP